MRAPTLPAVDRRADAERILAEAAELDPKSDALARAWQDLGVSGAKASP